MATRTYKWQHEAAVKYADKRVPKIKTNPKDPVIARIWCEEFSKELARLKAAPGPAKDTTDG